MHKMLITSTVLSLAAALCQAQAGLSLGLAFQSQAQIAPPSQQLAEFEGTVSDATGAVLPGATVTVKRAGSELKVATSDGEGKFRITGLTPGLLDISVTASGFADFNRQGFNLVAGQANALEVHLNVAAAATNVNVEGQRVIQVETENAE